MPAATLPPIEVAVTPRFDIFYALYSLESGGSSPLDAWREKARKRLPYDFEQIAGRVAPLPIFWPLLADAWQGTPGEITFDTMLSKLREIPAGELQRNLLSGVFHDRGVVDSLMTQKRTLAMVLGDEDLSGAALLEAFGLRPFDQSSPSVKTMTLLLTRPESFRDQLALALRKFWQSGFERDWSALEPRLRADARRIQQQSETSKPSDLGRELNFPLVFDDKASEARAKSGAPIAYDRIDRCYVLPSAFNTRRWWAKYETKKGRLTLYVPIVRVAGIANAVVEDERRAAPSSITHTSINAESVFRALGDTTRYAIASILART